MAKLFALICIISLFYPIVSLAQRGETAFPVSSAVAPSQNAVDGFSSVPVNLSTGTVQVSLPLAAIQGYNMQIPVSLGYQSSGIRVKDIAGPAGLGWSLAGGGVIARVVRDKPDDAYVVDNVSNYPTKGYAGAVIGDRGRAYELKLAIDGDPSSTNYSSNIKNFEKNKWDSEPDLYYFNFLGRSGQFFLNENKVPILVPQQDLKINLIHRTSSGEPIQQAHYTWVITTSDGTSFIFGDANQYPNPTDPGLCEITEYKTETPRINQCIPEETITTAFASSWYLQKIISPTGNVEAEFAYETGANFGYTDLTQISYELLKTVPSGASVGCYIIGTDLKDPDLYEAEVKNTTIIKNPRYLSRIYAPGSGSEINLTYGTKREAETAVRVLEVITVRNRGGEHLKRITFAYSFFGNTADTRRLRLDQVQDGNAPPYQFTYNPQETFLPERNSFQVDHWGYYNGKAINKHGIPDSYYVGEGLPGFLRTDPSYAPNINATTPFERRGADRTPDAAKMKACILTRITYPTGGWVAYEYGCHMYYNSVSKKDEPWGGLRIERVTTSDGVNPANNIVTNYSYTRADNALQSSGSVDASFVSTRTGKYSHDMYQRLMVVTERTEGSFVNDVLSYNFGMAIIEALTVEKKAIYYLVRSSQAMNSTAELCYSRVTVQQQGKGRAVHSFTSFFDPAHRDFSPEVYYMHRKIRIDQDFANNGNGYVLNYLSKTNRRWRRGLPTETWTFDETGKKKTWRQVNYGFRTETDAAKIVPGLVFYTVEVVSKDAQYLSEYPRSSFFGKYLETPEWVYVDNVTERLYDQNDDITFRETVTRYEYNFSNLQVAATHTSDGSGKTIIKRVKYAVDYPDVADDADTNPAYKPGQGDRRAAVNEMLRRHMTGIPLEVQVWQQVNGGEERLLSAKLNEFQFIPKPEGYPWYQFTDQFGANAGALGSFLKKTLVVPRRTLQLYTPAPIPVAPAAPATHQFSTLNTTTGQFTFDVNRFTQELAINQYDTRGNGLEVQEANRPASCTLLGNNATLMLAKVSNANYTQVAYTSFEAYGDKGNCNYTGGQPGDAKTGLQSFSGGTVSSNENLPAGTYKVSFWYKGSGATVNGNPVPASSEWKYHQQLLANPGKVTVSVTSAQLDELRLHPAESFMTSYTYRPGVGALSVTDVDGTIQYYEYDDMQRLKLVRDLNRKIIKSYFYHYKQ